MFNLIHARHALNKNTTVTDDMYIGECQDASKFSQDLVQGNLLICSYSVRFVLGLSTIQQALETAMNLSAVGVVFSMDLFVTAFQLNPVPMKMPGIIIPSANDSKVHCSFSPLHMYTVFFLFAFILLYVRIKLTYNLLGAVGTVLQSELEFHLVIRIVL